MPDIVYNRLEFLDLKNGDFDKLAMSYTKHTEFKRVLSLPLIVPQPQDILDRQANDGSMDSELHQWRLENWGTKWDVWVEDNYPLVGVNRETQMMYFHSAWAAPVSAIATLARMYDLHLKLTSVTECIGRAAAITVFKGDSRTQEIILDDERVVTLYAYVEQMSDEAASLAYEKYHDECDEE